MLKTHDYKDSCWWCGSEANSGEHKYKKTDIIREFGNGAYKDKDEIVRVINGQSRKVQGPKSNELKFRKNICQKCNNQRSHEFDICYDLFTKFIKEHEAEIVKTKQFTFSEIYGNDWENKKINLLRYYTKHICCRLAESNIFIRDEIINFLNGSNVLLFIDFYLQIRQDIVSMIELFQQEGLDDGCCWIGDMTPHYEDKEKTLLRISSFHGYRWLRMYYAYNCEYNESANNFPEDVTILTSDYNIDPEKVKNGTHGLFTE